MEPADAPQLPAGEATVALLTRAASVDPAVPSHLTVVATLAAAAVLLLMMTLAVRLAADRIGPAPAGADPCRWLAAGALALLAAAATVHVGVA